MSTIKTDTLSNLLGTKSVPTDTVVAGSAKVWVSFNGTGTVAIRRAFNVSSITDNGVGQYTINFTTAMGSVDYMGILVPFATATGNTGVEIATTTTSLYSFRTTFNGALIDFPFVSAAFHF